jgi:hypothetical protein
LRRAAVVGVITMLGGCGGRAANPGPSVRAPSQIERAAPAPQGDARDAPRAARNGEETGAVVAAALVETSRTRELPATAPVRGVSLSRAEMTEHVRAAIERELPARVLEAEGEVLVAFGAAPPGFDYMKAIVALMSAELAGYYEPTEKTMYLAADLGSAERAATLSHELVHALQDQHYDLGRLLEYRPDESDAQGAIHALAEGDATSAMLDQLLAAKGMKATDLSDQLIGVQVRAGAAFDGVAGDVPPILKRSLIEPYVDGVNLVHWLRRRAGWGEVDRVWRDPPVSTEQLLHPEKLLAHEPPLVMDVPPPPTGMAPGPEYTDVFGEQSVRLLLEEWLPRGPSVDAAAGWGGDRLALYRSGSRSAVAWHLRYDDVASAERGLAALRRVIAAQAPDGGHEKPRALDCTERPTVGPFLVARRGRDLAVVLGPYEVRDATTVGAGTCAEAESWAKRVLAQHR